METFECSSNLLSGWVRRSPACDYLSGLRMESSRPRFFRLRIIVNGYLFLFPSPALSGGTLKLSDAACPRPLECLVRPSFPQLRGAESFPLLPVAMFFRCPRISQGYGGNGHFPQCGIQKT